LTDTLALLLSKGAFGFAICVILYLIYYEYEQNKIAKEKAIIELGEKKNEDEVSKLTPDELIDLVTTGKLPNTEPGIVTKKPGDTI
jgi:hypothetical protein